MTRTVTIADLKNRPADSQLIDVRSPSEFASGHIPGAINIPMEQIESRLDDLSPTKPITLICQVGKRARMTAGLLGPCNLEISVLEGGTGAWINSGLPTVRSIPSRWSLERQVRLGAGLLIVMALTLAICWNPRWGFLAAFVGFGLTFAGLTDICPMAELLRRLPWNKVSHCQVRRSEADLSRSCH